MLDHLVPATPDLAASVAALRAEGIGHPDPDRLRSVLRALR